MFRANFVGKFEATIPRGIREDQEGTGVLSLIDTVATPFFLYKQYINKDAYYEAYRKSCKDVALRARLASIFHTHIVSD